MAASSGLSVGKLLLSLGASTVKALNASVLLPCLSLAKCDCACCGWLSWEGQLLSLELPAGVGVLEGTSVATGEEGEGGTTGWHVERNI